LLIYIIYDRDSRQLMQVNKNTDCKDSKKDASVEVSEKLITQSNFEYIHLMKLWKIFFAKKYY
jgi:hypothetical protein